jgi:CRISPR system Cascade subunit CasC
MSQFIQLHLLTSYPPSNLNRDDMGRPKTAKMGGVDRLRISSQSLKRAWRTSDLFKSAVDGHLGTRTKKLGIEVYRKFTEGKVDEKNAIEWAKSIAGVFGKLKGKDSGNAEAAEDKEAKKKKGKESEKDPLSTLEIEQLAHISPEEWDAVMDLVEKCVSEGKRAPKPEELNLLRKPESAVDIALFGRMLAANPIYNEEAACQVSHAISVHPVVIEDDYFTAVDDLNKHEEDAGAAHIGERGFAAALFYTYICINKDLLVENLGKDAKLANKAISALTEAAVKVSPTGMQNSHATRAYASYVLAEKGEQQPRSLSVAFLKPIEGKKYGEDSIKALQEQQENMDKVYGPCADSRYSLNAIAGKGTMKELLEFVAK